MECKPDVLKHVPLFSLLDDEELKVLAGQVEIKEFRARQRIYKMGDPNGVAYVMVTGRVRVSTIDEDHQEVVVDEPSHGEFFGLDRKSTRLNSSHSGESRMPSSA